MRTLLREAGRGIFPGKLRKGLLRTGFLEAEGQLGNWVSWLEGTQSKGKIEGYIQGQMESGVSFQEACNPSKAVKTESKAKGQLRLGRFSWLLRVGLSY